MTALLLSLALAAIPVDPLVPGSPAVLRGHTDVVTAVAFSPDGKTIASGSRDKTVRLWSLETGAVLQTIEGSREQPISIVFSADGKRLAIADSSFEVRVIELPAGTVAQTLVHPDTLSQVAFDPAGAWLMVTGFNGNGGLYSLKDGKKLYSLRANSVGMLPDGKEAIVATSDHFFKTVELKSGKLRQPVSTDTQSPVVVVSRDGSTLVTWSPSAPEVRVWDRKTGKVTSTLTPPAPDALMPEKRQTNELVSVVISNDGKRLVTSAADRVVRVWDLTQGTIVKTFPVQQQVKVALSPDGAWVAAGDTGTVKLFKLSAD